MIRAAIYARVSTAEQAEEGYSIDAQIDTVTRKCEQEGRQVIFKYIDRGVSGKSIKNRLFLQQLLIDAKEKKFDEVWVWKINRLARNHLDLLKIVDELNMQNIGFKSCSEAIDTSTPTGKLMMNVIGSIGEFERESIVENVKMGMKQRAKQGKWNGGQVLGYKSININGIENKTRLEIVDSEANIVEHIFQLYAEGRGLKSLTNYINKLGYKTKKGNLFSINGVKEILMNPIYIGKIRYNRRENWSEMRRRGMNKNPILVDGEHKAIISVELWERVQKLYSQRSNKPTRIYSGSYPLTGLLKCPVCGSSMVAGRVKKKHKDGSFIIYRYYHCGAWRNKGTAACRSNSVKADYVESFVFNKIQEVLNKENTLRDIVKRMNKSRRDVIKPIEDRLKEIEKINIDLENKRSRIFELYEEGIIDKGSLSTRLNLISKEVESNLENKELLQKKMKLNNSEPIEFNLVKKLMGKFNEIINNADHYRKKTILNLVIERVNINIDREVDSIVMQFNSKSRRDILGEKEGESSVEDSPSFNFSITL